MANHLKAAKVLSIQALHDQGWSQRRIARELGVSREAVAKHLQANSNQAKAPTGSGAGPETSKPAKAPTASRSACGPFHELIVAKLEQGLSAQRIFQDLADDHGFDQKYHSVRRYVAELQRSNPLPFRRVEVMPGEEAQIDFGTGAPVIDHTGRRRKTHVLRVVLSHSRKAYSEVVFRQSTDNLIQVLENAFMHLGGVPKTLVPDNLKAAVIKADWYDPDLNPKLQSFCEHYGTVLLPTKPRMPRHKGKVERGVAYVQDNALKGRTFESLEQQNEHLLQWESRVADTRLHGTTKQQVLKMFEEHERAAMGPLPADRFACFKEAKRTVSRDGHIAVNNSYYSVPPEYVGREVWVRFDSHLVRVFTESMKPICVHATAAMGKFSTLREHIASEKISIVEHGASWLLQKVSKIGPHTRSWSEALVATRGVQSVRVMQGLIQLSRKHSSELIEQACASAHSYGEYRLATIRKLISRATPTQEAFDFLDHHPIIRNLSDYGDVVRVHFGKEAKL